MKKYGFIFDMDGVIIDSNPYHKVSLRQFCLKHGVQLSDEDLISKIYGRTNKDWITLVFGNLSPGQLEQYAQEKEMLYRTMHEKDIEPLRGLRQFLVRLKEEELPCAIGTSAPVENVDFVLGKTGLREFFNVILKDTDISASKPDPEIYLKTAKAIGVPPDRCIVFEDSLSGIAAGLAAGTKVVGVATTHSPAELGHTHYVIHDFEGLDPIRLIDRVFGPR